MANGNDLRIFYDVNGTFGGTEVEIDRVLWDQDGVTSTWDASDTKVAFKLQAAIDASTTDSTHYRVYYNDPDASTPPTNKNNVYLWFDGFDSDTSANYTTTGASISVSGGYATVGVGSSLNGVVYSTSVGDGNFCFEAKYKNSTANGSSSKPLSVWKLENESVISKSSNL